MNKRKIPILMYHSISTPKKDQSLRGMNVPPKLFKQHMRILSKLGFKGLSMKKLMPYIEGKKFGKVVGITFDDGYKNLINHALPVLKHYSFSATTYIVSDLIGKKNEWDSKKNIPENPLMNKKEIFLWIDNGMEIGSHTSSHCRLTECRDTELEYEITKSKEDLSRAFKCEVEHFCYPYGAYSTKVVSKVVKSGYKTATTVQRGRYSLEGGRFTIPRILVNHRTYFFQFILKILTNYEENK